MGDHHVHTKSFPHDDEKMSTRPITALFDTITRPQPHIPHIAWTKVLNQTQFATVAMLHCFGKPCRSDEDAVQVRRGDESHLTSPHHLIVKLFHYINHHRLHVQTTKTRHGRGVMKDDVHWLMFSDHHTILCDAFTLEVLVSYLLCDTKRRPQPCWSPHVPCHLYHFVHSSRTLGGIVMTHEGISLRAWKKTASALELLVVLFQVAATLHCLQRHLHFKHNDLHDENVLVWHQTLPKDAPPCVRYVIDDVEYFVPNIGIMVRIIDFQFATLQLSNGHKVVRADTFLNFQWSQRTCVPSDKATRRFPTHVTTSAQWWRPSLSHEWGYDLQVLVSSLFLSFLSNSKKKKEKQRVMANALRALGIRDLSRRLYARLGERPSAQDTSDVKPRMFLMRVFGGHGQFAICNFRRPPNHIHPETLPLRMSCGHIQTYASSTNE